MLAVRIQRLIDTGMDQKTTLAPDSVIVQMLAAYIRVRLGGEYSARALEHPSVPSIELSDALVDAADRLADCVNQAFSRGLYTRLPAADAALNYAGHRFGMHEAIKKLHDHVALLDVKK